jgi:hypothetical protein
MAKDNIVAYEIQMIAHRHDADSRLLGLFHRMLDEKILKKIGADIKKPVLAAKFDSPVSGGLKKPQGFIDGIFMGQHLGSGRYYHRVLLYARQDILQAKPFHWGL